MAFASQPKVTVQDQYGNTVTTDTSSVTIAVTGGAATLSGCAANATAGTYNVGASAPGTGTVNFSMTNMATMPVGGIILSFITTDTFPAILPTLPCSGTVAARTCSSLGEGNSTGNVLVAKLTLVDASGNVIVNTGGQIDIDLAVSGDGKVSPTGAGALSVPNGSSATSAWFTLTRNNGNGKTVTMTATVQGRTLTVTLSS